MSERPRHPNKAIEAAVRYAEDHGWRFKKSNPRAHSWGRILCPYAQRGGCRPSVWSTPRRPEEHAFDIKEIVNKCPHQKSKNFKSS